MKERLEEFGTLVKRLQKEYPNETLAFMNFMKKAEEGHALSSKFKELINVAGSGCTMRMVHSVPCSRSSFCGSYKR